MEWKAVALQVCVGMCRVLGVITLRMENHMQKSKMEITVIIIEIIRIVIIVVIMVIIIVIIRIVIIMVVIMVIIIVIIRIVIIIIMEWQLHGCPALGDCIASPALGAASQTALA